MKKIKFAIIVLVALIVGCETDDSSKDEKKKSLTPKEMVVQGSPWVLNPEKHVGISTCENNDYTKQFFDSQYYEEYKSDGTFYLEGRNWENCAFTDKYTQEGTWIISDDATVVDYNIDGGSSNAKIITLTEKEFVYIYNDWTFYLIPKN